MVDRRAAGAHAAELAPHVLELRVHPLLHFGEQAFQIVDVHTSPVMAGGVPASAQALTVVPTGSPMMTRRMLPGRPQVEDDDRQLVVHAERDGGGVHHLEPLLEHLQIRDRRRYLRRGRVEHRVGGVDAVDLGALEDHVRLASPSRAAPRRCRCVKYGLPVPAAKTTTRPFSRWRMARRRMNGSATARISIAVATRVTTPMLLERVLQRQRVDDRGQHAHVVGGRAVHALARWPPGRGRCCRRR